MKALVIILSIFCIILIGLLIKAQGAKPDGYIVINKSDPNEDVYTLELNIAFGELDVKKKVIFHTRIV